MASAGLRLSEGLAGGVSDAPATGAALRFLLLLLAIWIGGRIFANGALDGTAPPPLIEQMLLASAPAADSSGQIIAGGKALAPRRIQVPIVGESAILAAHTVRLPLPIRASSGGGSAMMAPDIFASHQLLFWQNAESGFASGEALPRGGQNSLAAQNFESDTASSADPKAGPEAERVNGRNPLPRNRWALDSWAFFRPGNSLQSLSAQTIGGRAQYGGSQAGAIARYYPWRSANAPSLFVRATGSLSSPRQTELAAGISVRPIKRIPLRFAAEQRLAVSGGGRSQPSVYVVTEIAPQRLPGGVRANIYGQAGIVGAQDSAYFFDLQVVAEKPVLQKGQRELVIGAGLWSGGQGPVSGAASGPTGLSAGAIAEVNRLDIGPSIAAHLPVGGQQMRIALDWRQRVAGNAAPGSGPALTVSTQF